ncbi:DnaJ domain-containing protein [Gaertneriomyces semiglobifer]|nr:DnaJ domain-containing protein [Gaertneriomyces semiglobifer]
MLFLRPVSRHCVHLSRHTSSRGIGASYARAASTSTPIISWPHHELSPYDVLKLPTTATLKDIKAHYYQLSLEHHPDRTVNKPTAEQAQSQKVYMLIQDAYHLLSDDLARAQYHAAATINRERRDATEGHCHQSADLWTQGYSPANASKVLKPFLLGLTALFTLSSLVSYYALSQHEREHDLAWAEWAAAREREGLGDALGYSGYSKR